MEKPNNLKILGDKQTKGPKQDSQNRMLVNMRSYLSKAEANIICNGNVFSLLFFTSQLP